MGETLSFILTEEQYRGDNFQAEGEERQTEQIKNKEQLCANFCIEK